MNIRNRERHQKTRMKKDHRKEKEFNKTKTNLTK